MNNKVIGGLLAVLGVVVVIAGIVLMTVIVPGMKQFPDDVDTTRYYGSFNEDLSPGTMNVLLNSATFEFLTDFPVTLERHFMTEETDGDLALVLEEQKLYAVSEAGDTEGQVLQTLVKRYAINRETMMFADEYPDEWASMEGFWPRQGLVLGWPIDSEKKDYDGWSDDYRDIVPLVFEGEIEHERSGLDVYFYTATSELKEIDPDAVVAMGLPQGLPKEQFQSLIESADVSDTMKRLLPALLTQWEEDLVPLKYYYEYWGEYWVEPQTGALIDTHKYEMRQVGLGDEFMAISPMLSEMTEEQRAASRVTVFELTYQGTEQSVEDAKNDAQDIIDQLQLFGTTIPIVMIVVGAVLALAGAFLFMRKPAAS